MGFNLLSVVSLLYYAQDIQGFILATDLAHHGGFMKAGKEIAGEFKTSNPEHVQMVSLWR